jgi:hypothetical protein
MAVSLAPHFLLCANMPQHNKICKYIEDSVKRPIENNSTPSTINSLILSNRIPCFRWSEIKLTAETIHTFLHHHAASFLYSVMAAILEGLVL